MELSSVPLDIESLRARRFRLVLVGRDEQRVMFKARLVTMDTRLMLFGLSPTLPEGEAPGGCDVEVSYADDDGLHTFTSRAVAMSTHGGLWIRRAERIYTLQRRAHFRVRAKVAGKATVQRPDSSATRFAFETQDMSAGGIRFNSPTPLGADDDINLELVLPGEGRIAGRARLARCAPRCNGVHTIGAYFERLPSGVESRIIRFLNQEQIRIRKRVKALVPSSPHSSMAARDIDAP